MYAIVEINGQQFKAEEGKSLFVHHIKDVKENETVEFDKVLLVDKAMELAQTTKVRLLIVDSLTSHFRAEYVGRGDRKRRQQNFSHEVLDLPSVATG